MNWWLGGIWLVACGGVGIYLYRQSAERVKFYAGLIDFCHYLTAEIGFHQQSLPELLAHYHSPVGGKCCALLADYQKILIAKADLTREKCQTLTPDRTVAEFLYSLGRLGSAEERDKIAAAQAVFADRHTAAQHHLQTKASITLKLLIIIGIAGVILWI